MLRNPNTHSHLVNANCQVFLVLIVSALGKNFTLRTILLMKMQILSSLDEALQQADPSSTIVLGCEQDIEEGIAAAKAGLRTFTGEWFMQSIVKQDLDMSANLIEKI